MKTPDTGRLRSLAELELEVEAEGREWTRQRLQQRLQEEADALGAFFPSGRPAAAGAATPRPHPAQPGRRG
jgi:hypothetical protein